MRNTTLLAAANKIMKNTSPAQFVISAQFISSSSGSKFSFFPFMIEKIKITRDYLENYADVMTMTMKISVADYARLQDQGQNLLCTLTITYIDPSGKIVYSPTPIQRQYNVIINDARDVRKAVPDSQYYTEPVNDITVQLVEPTIYKLRHTKINTVYQNATMTQAIHAITQAFGIEKIQMVALDNVHQYDHVDISSYQGIDMVFGYLQKKFGLYPKGASAYITGDVLYIYPPFETAPIYDRTAIFYQVGTGDYSGNHIFHKLDNNNVSIVVNTQPESFDLSVAGSENHGTGFIFTRASRLSDGFTAIDQSKGAQFTDQPSLSVSLNNSRPVVEGSNNMFHIPATDNPFPTMSEIIAHQASLMKVNWMHADPFRIDPGHAVNYYYDRNEIMVRKTGIVEHAYYEISRMERKDTLDRFGSVGQLTLRLSPNETMVLS